MNNNILILLIVIVTIVAVCLFTKNVEGYHNHEYTYAPYFPPMCKHTYDNNPIPNGYEGTKCLTSNECNKGLTCCWEQPGFELAPIDGRCRRTCSRYRNLLKVLPHRQY